MIDDLFNFWGTRIIDPPVSGQSSTRGIRNTTLGDKDTKFGELNNKFRALTSQKYFLLRVESCGSTANCLAIVEATKGKTDSCLFAIGSYIAGDQGYMQSLSFMSRQLKIKEDSIHEIKGSGVFLPLKLESVDEHQVRCHVALPYYLPESGLACTQFKKRDT